MSLFARNVARCGMDIDILCRRMEPVNGNLKAVFYDEIPIRSIVKTKGGIKGFDSVNTDDHATHEICVPAVRGVPIESLINVGALVSATTANPHSLRAGDIITVTGAIPSEYNVVDAVVTITSPTEFTYSVAVAPTEIQTGSPVASYFIGPINSERWVRLKGRLLKILNVENCCEKDEVFILSCTERGSEVRDANAA